MNTTDQVTQQIESAIPALMQRIKEETLARIEREAVAAATAIAVETARKWTEENLVPEIAAQLNAGKAGFVAAAESAAQKISDELTEAMLVQVRKSFSNSYTVKQIAETMFKGY